VDSPGTRLVPAAPGFAGQAVDDELSAGRGVEPEGSVNLAGRNRFRRPP